MTQNRAARFIAFPLLWAAVLGGVGFVCGFLGPIILNPSANQGPLLGIFFTGPLGFLAGLVLGFIAAALNLSVRIHVCCLSLISLLAATGVLYMSTPEPRYRGTVIDAEIVGCSNPSALITNAVSMWEEAVRTKDSWRKVRQDWRQDVDRMLSGNDGVVLDLHVIGERKIYEHRKPWNRGTITATPWSDQATNKSFFARYAGPSCDAYTIGERNTYFLVWESSPAWPADKLSRFLGLHVVESVPDKYRDLVGEKAANKHVERDECPAAF